MQNKLLTLKQRCEFAKHQSPLLNSSRLAHELDDLHKLIQDQIQDSVLLDELEKTFQSTLILIKVAPHYDYSPNHRANGFWTFAQITIKFFRLTLFTIKRDCFNLSSTLNALEVLNISLNYCVEIANCSANNNNNDDEDERSSEENSRIDSNSESEATSVEGPIEVLECCHSRKSSSLFVTRIEHEDIITQVTNSHDAYVDFYANYNGFWLHSCAMQVIGQISDFMGIFYKQSTDFRIRNIFSRRRKAKMFAEMTLNVSVNELKKAWNVGEHPLVGKFFNRFARDDKTVSVREIAIASQKRWKISADEPSKVYDCTEMDADLLASKSVTSGMINGIPCLILQSKLRDPNKLGALLVHAHGGGFISQSPRSHKVYLQDWISKYEDLTIISVDYRLAPEHQFPAGLQDLLDVYLWCLQPTSAAFLGFKPTKIALAGDSAGGNLVVALSLVLNEVQKNIAHSLDDPFAQEFFMPQSIFSFYGVYMIAPHNSPSRVVSLNDGLLNLGPLMTCLHAYLPVKLDDGESFHHYATNPFLSPLLAKDLEFSRNISLHLFETHFDPFLDDNVEFAKVWKGPLRFKVFADLPHGFLSFIKASPKSQQANDECLEHFAQFCS